MGREYINIFYQAWKFIPEKKITSFLEAMRDLMRFSNPMPLTSKIRNTQIRRTNKRRGIKLHNYLIKQIKVESIVDNFIITWSVNYSFWLNTSFFIFSVFHIVPIKLFLFKITIIEDNFCCSLWKGRKKIMIFSFWMIGQHFRCVLFGPCMPSMSAFWLTQVN